MERILVVRPDRLGDVVLSLPVLTLLKRHYPDAKITFAVQSWIADGLEPILKGIEVLRIPNSRSEWRNLVKSHHFDAAVVLQSKLAVTLGIFRAGIPIRVGPVGKPHTWFLFNKRIRQNRSKVEKHESQYNCDLLKELGVEIPENIESFFPAFKPNPESLYSVKAWLEAHDLFSKYVVVHPGMGGSAENWPKDHYQKLVKELTEQSVRVVITHGVGEFKLAEKIKGNTPAIIFGGHAPKSLSELGALYAGAKCVIAPSTGPLHWAAAFGAPVVSFYPKIRVQSAKRWGPLATSSKKSVFIPDVGCKAVFRCNGPKCPDYPCMQKIPVASVLNAVISYYES